MQGHLKIFNKGYLKYNVLSNLGELTDKITIWNFWKKKWKMLESDKINEVRKQPPTDKF